MKRVHKAYRQIRRQWHTFRSAPPGQRFQKLHESRSTGRGPQADAQRHVWIIVGVLIFVAGLALLPLPGPGSLVAVAGLGMIARESLVTARMLDAMDKKLEGWICPLLRKWRNLARGRRLGLVTLCSALLVAGCAGVYWLRHG